MIMIVAIMIIRRGIGGGGEEITIMELRRGHWKPGFEYRFVTFSEFDSLD